MAKLRFIRATCSVQVSTLYSLVILKHTHHGNINGVSSQSLLIIHSGGPRHETRSKMLWACMISYLPSESCIHFNERITHHQVHLLLRRIFQASDKLQIYQQWLLRAPKDRILSGTVIMYRCWILHQYHDTF